MNLHIMLPMLKILKVENILSGGRLEGQSKFEGYEMESESFSREILRLLRWLNIFNGFEYLRENY